MREPPAHEHVIPLDDGGTFDRHLDGRYGMFRMSRHVRHQLVGCQLRQDFYRHVGLLDCPESGICMVVSGLLAHMARPRGAFYRPTVNSNTRTIFKRVFVLAISAFRAIWQIIIRR